MRRLPLLLLAFALVACAETPETPASTNPPTASPEDRATPVRTASVPDPEPATLRAFENALAFAERERLAEGDFGMTVQRLAAHFRGAEYVDGLLDVAEEETLVINLTAFDCVLFVEKVLALAQSVHAGETEYEPFARRVEALRYRDGRLDGYCSRLHYFTDWIRDNDRRGLVEDITAGLSAAEPMRGETVFMTSNRQLYPRLAPDDTFACVVEAERDLNTASFSYVPQNRIRQVYDQLEAGDVIAVTSGIDGLDIAHTGFVYKHEDGRTGFVHASTSGQVVINQDLQEYVTGNRRQTGIVVARPVLGGDGVRE